MRFAPAYKLLKDLISSRCEIFNNILIYMIKLLVKWGYFIYLMS